MHLTKIGFGWKYACNSCKTNTTIEKNKIRFTCGIVDYCKPQQVKRRKNTLRLR
jgi:hypothetical protein